MASIFDRINSIPENKNTAAPVATPTPGVTRGASGSTGSITDRISAIPTTEKEDSKTESSKRESIWERIKNNLGYVGESGKVGLFEGTEGVINEMGYLGQNAFDGVEMQQAMQAEAWAKVFDWLGIGDGKAAERQARTTESVRENLESGELVDVASFGDKAAQELADKYGEQKGVTKFAGDIARGAGQLIPGVAASAVTGVPGLGIATSALSAAGNATQEAKNAGADDSKAMGYGLLTGGIEAGTEALFGGMGGIFGKGLTDDAVKALIEQRIRSEGVQKVLKALVSAGFEGAEEVVAEIAQRIANEATVDTDDRGVGETFKDALYSGAVGAALGGAGDAIGAGVRGIRNRQVNIDNANPAAYNETNNGGGADGAQLHRTAGEGVRAGRDGNADNSAVPERRELGPKDLRDSGVVLLSPQSRNTLTKRGVVTEDYSASEDKAAFSAALDRARNADTKNGWAVSPQNADDLAEYGTKTYLSPRANSGFGVTPDGDIVGVFANKAEGAPKGVSKSLLPQAIAAGGIKLDCYGSELVRLYSGYGFIPVARVEFNAEYANPGYTPDKGTPYVYVMMHNGDSADAVVENMGKYPQYTAEQLNALPTYGKDDYDAAIAYRDSLIEQGKAKRATGAAAAGELDTPFNQWRDSTDAPLHEMGEKATRYLGVPTQDRVNPDMRTMKTPQTIAEAAVTTDENAARIENAYYNGDYSYVPVVDAKLAEQASAAIEGKSWNDALKDWTAAVRSGKANAQLVAEGAVLINNAGNNEAASAETYADLVLDYSTLLHNAGQALQAARILKMLTPEGRLYGIQKSVQRMSEEMSKYLKKRGIEKVEIPEALFEEYRNAQDDAARDAVVEKMQQTVADQLPGTWLERWTALRYVNMLGNFKTQVRNLLGNTTMRATYALKNQVANLVEAVANKATGGKVQRTKSAFVGTDWMRAAKGDYLTVKDAIAGSGKYNDMQDAGNAFERGVHENRRIFKSGFLEGYRKATNWAMEQGDILFSKGIYARSLAGYLKAKGFNPQQLTYGSISTEVLDDARLYAIKEAQEATFRDNNAFSGWVSKIGRRSDTHPLGKVAAEGLAPFRKTPANVMVRAEEFSPLGFVNTVVTAVKAGKGQASVNDIINSASKALTGSAMVGLGWLLADMGVLRGVPDEDEQAADELMNYQNYAFVLPNGATYTLDWAAPASLLLFVGAAAQDAYSDGDLSWRDIEGAITSLTEPMVQMSMLSGINDALDGIKYSDNNLLQMAGTMIASYLTQGLTNTLLGQVERISEENRMTTYTKSDSPLPDWVQRAIGKASAKTPIGDFQQTEYLDEFGNTESNGGIGERILENLFSPGYYNESNEGKPAYDFAFEMNRLLGYDAFPATYTDSEIEYKDKTYELTQEEKELWQKTRGEIAEDHLTAASNSEAFDALSDEQKRDVLQTLKTFANAQGKNEVLEEKGVKPEVSDLDKARASLRAGDFVTYYSILTAANDVLDGATAQEVSTLEKLLGMGIPTSVSEVLEKDSGFANLLEAVNAGVSVQHYYDYTVVKSQWNASPAPGYGSAPNWQKFNAIGGMNIPQEEKLALIGGVSENFLEKAQEAVNQGVSLSDVLRYYEAITARNADGSDKNKAQKNAAAQALNLGYNLAILNGIFG